MGYEAYTLRKAPPRYCKSYIPKPDPKAAGPGPASHLAALAVMLGCEVVGDLLHPTARYKNSQVLQKPLTPRNSLDPHYLVPHYPFRPKYIWNMAFIVVGYQVMGVQGLFATVFQVLKAVILVVPCTLGPRLVRTGRAVQPVSSCPCHLGFRVQGLGFRV